MTDQPTDPIPESGAAVSQDEKTWGMLAHLSALGGFIIPFGSVLGPLIVWLLKKDEMPFVDQQGKEALNFQITMAIGFVVCVLLMFVLIGIPLFFALMIYALIMTIIATIEANKGKHYQYPFALRLIT